MKEQKNDFNAEIKVRGVYSNAEVRVRGGASPCHPDILPSCDPGPGRGLTSILHGVV